MQIEKQIQTKNQQTKKMSERRTKKARLKVKVNNINNNNTYSSGEKTLQKNSIIHRKEL